MDLHGTAKSAATFAVVQEVELRHEVPEVFGLGDLRDLAEAGETKTNRLV